jgi:type IV pilus assembly protein PilM
MAHRKRTLLPIGIHLGAEAVNMVQLDQAEGDVRVVSKASLSYPRRVPSDLPDLDAEGEVADMSKEEEDAQYELALSFIRKKITSNGFRNKDAVISLPSRHLVIQHVRLAAMQPEEMAAALMYELRGKLPFEPQQAVVRHIVAGTVSENNEAKQDVIVLAARRSVVEKHVAGMAHLGLRVVGVGAEPCAMCYPYGFAAAHASPSQEGPPTLMIVHLGASRIHVAILRAQETTFVKEVLQGTSHLTKSLAKAQNMPVDSAVALRASWCEKPGPEHLQAAVEAYKSIRPVLEHLCDEIESCMRYHASLARGARVDRLYFVGPDARDRGLVHVLSAHLAVPCDLGDPVGAITGHGDREHAEPEMAVAAGLSLFGAQ